MKRKRISAILSVLVLFLSSSLCLLTSFEVNNAVEDRIYIFSRCSENTFFDKKDITFFERENSYFSFTDRQYLKASTVIAEDKAEVVRTNENYAHIARLKFISGSYFNEIHIKKKNNVVVLSSAASWKFFGTIYSTGNFIYINNKGYQVIGVFENDLTHKDKILMYIPFDNLSEHDLDKSAAISDIWLNLSDISEAGLIITRIGYSQEDIVVTQMDQYKNIIMQRFRIIIFIVGLLIIIFLCKKIFQKIRILGKELTVFLSENYVSDILSIFKKKSFSCGVLFNLFYILLVLMIIRIISFKVCVPSVDLLSGSFDVTKLCRILDFYVQSHIGILSLQYLNDLNVLSNILFIASLFSIYSFVHCLCIDKSKAKQQEINQEEKELAVNKIISEQIFFTKHT